MKVKRKQYRFPFDGWHITVKLEADNKEDAIKRFHKIYKKDYDYNKIQVL